MLHSETLIYIGGITVMFKTLGTAILVAICVASASAATYLNEPFNYAAGSLNGQGGWGVFSGTAGQTQVLATASDSGNSLAAPAGVVGAVASSGNRIQTLAASSEDTSRPLTSVIQGTTG